MKNVLKGLIGVVMVIATLTSCKKDRQEDVFDPYKQLQVDEQLIKDYIADSIPAIRHEKGLYYVVLEPGAGVAARDQDTITVNYTGRIMDGEIFGSDEDFKYPLFRLIGGWRIGIPLIKKGGKIRLFIPSGYAYGPQGAGNVPPNAILDFTIDLLDVE